MISPTSSDRGQPLVSGHFETLIDALEYAALCDTGFNFYTGKGDLKVRLPYTELRDRAVEAAKRLVPLTEIGDRVGICAVTSADFVTMFYACQYAGVIPAPLPLPVTLGGAR